MGVDRKIGKKNVFASKIINRIDISTLCKRSVTFGNFHEDTRIVLSRIIPGVRHRGHALI